MEVVFFSSKAYDQQFFSKANEEYKHHLKFLETHLNEGTAVLANGYGAICIFVNDIVNKEALQVLAEQGIKLVALRCAGFNNVDLGAAEELGINIVRVPAYSPYSVAEHTVALYLPLTVRPTGPITVLKRAISP
ncbi:Rossmann-fold NAD(P)-binding domain-containing protein [Pontibacter kalidii]|uniref:hypothetical protein n=1 Tax=Pontibacter kalidii TaxID=2592049 RepID=UPI002B1CC2F3|nr:hypothetical protein [Pontibacter kalidii]